jgi:chromatin remodeling complex protein RSC6
MNAATAGSAKGAKKVTKKTEEVAAPAPAPVAAAAPVAEKKAVKAKAAAKVEAAPAPAAPAPAPVAAPAAAEPAAEEPRLEDEVKAVTTALLAVREQVSKLVTEAKRLEKRAAKVQKLADKRRRRRTAEPGADGKPARVSIFQIPVPLSKELCSFMGRAAGSQESRSNVTKYITNYVKENNLKNKHDINADAKLRGLLGLKTDDKLTYFNLQKYLNPHYVKPAATA